MVRYNKFPHIILIFLLSLFQNTDLSLAETYVCENNCYGQKCFRAFKRIDNNKSFIDINLDGTLPPYPNKYFIYREEKNWVASFYEEMVDDIGPLITWLVINKKTMEFNLESLLWLPGEKRGHEGLVYGKCKIKWEEELIYQN